MDKITIYKDKAIEAIETEPVLLPGSWFHSIHDVKKCEVCAVGSILREHCFTTRTLDPSWCIMKSPEMNNNIFGYESNFREENDVLKNNNAYLANLSHVFEKACRIDHINPNSDEMRALLVSEICAMWPDSFEFEFESDLQ